MGCVQANEQATLICFYETGNETQKAYCIKLKDNWHNEKGIKFEIKSVPQVKFAIKFKVKEKLHEIQKEFDDSEETMKETLQKAYDLLK
jgi:hypothetical protein